MERTTTLSSCCPCGAVISAPCEFHQIAEVRASFDAQGWGYDERGSVQCPECLADPVRAAQHRAKRDAERNGEPPVEPRPKASRRSTQQQESLAL